MALPKSLIYIEVLPGGPRLKYAQRGGGVFRNENTAKDRIADLKRSNKRFRVMRLPNIEWVELYTYEPDETER